MPVLESVDKSSIFAIILSVACPIAAGLVVLSPIPTIYTICCAKNTLKYSFFPFLCMNVATAAWLLYGILTLETTIIVANSVALFFNILYSSLYILYSKRSKTLTRMYVLYPMAVFILSVPFIVTSNQDERILLMGIVVIFFHLIFMSSPLAVMRTVLKDKSVESMPLSITIALFVNAICWFLYGLLVLGEMPLIVSDSISLAITLIQLLLHTIYGNLLNCSVCYCMFPKGNPIEPELKQSALETE